jgi:hypothetical protein
MMYRNKFLIVCFTVSVIGLVYRAIQKQILNDLSPVILSPAVCMRPWTLYDKNGYDWPWTIYDEL